jgi:uncharacterized ferredoxin-like protein
MFCCCLSQAIAELTATDEANTVIVSVNLPFCQSRSPQFFRKSAEVLRREQSVVLLEVERKGRPLLDFVWL